MSANVTIRSRRVVKKLVQVGARGFIVNVLGLLTVTLSLFGNIPLTAVSAVVTLGLSLFFTQIFAPSKFRAAITGARPIRVLGAYTLSRTLVAVAVGLMALRQGEAGVLAWLPALLFATMVIAEPVIATVTNVARPAVVNAPWGAAQRPAPFGLPVIFLLNTVGLLIGSLLAAFGISPILAMVFPLLSIGLAPIAVAHARARVGRNRRLKEALTQDLTEYAPKFILYWEAAVGTTYQVAMWIPYLDRLGEKYVVVLRNERNLPQVAPLTEAPVIVCGPMAELDAVVVPSVSTVFYVNNAIRNCHFVRFPQLTHIQLNHGDSDKAPSFNPVMRMYDRNFVAGQAAIDRFAANGIEVRENFFTIVGRPQVADVLVRASTSSQPERTTVLYAPTWAGFMADSNYSSLPVGPELVATLLKHGANVIFRPHPHSRNHPALADACQRIEELLAADREATGAAHVFGPVAEVETTIFECFNLSDAMVSDVSSVVPDYLFSEKPLALVAMRSSYDEFLVNNPIAAAAYVIDEALANLSTILDDFLGADSMEAERTRVKGHYLGNFGDRDYGQVFLDEARRYI